MKLTEKPFYLDDEAIAWVEDTLESLTVDEKIGQLFVPIGYSTEKEYLDHLASFNIGGLLGNLALKGESFLFL